jgi:hypothetical protein
MQAFGLKGLALEWHEDLAPVVEAFLATGTLADHWLLWPGDGRITAGHLAVLAERAAAGPLEVILFDGTIGAGWSWSDRDEAMTRRILAATAAGTRTLAVAGNAHTPTRPTELGVPMGGLAGPAAAGGGEIQINYNGGRYYNGRPRRFGPRGPRPRRVRLHQRHDGLILDLPAAAEALVPQRSQGWPPARTAP